MTITLLENIHTRAHAVFTHHTLGEPVAHAGALKDDALRAMLATTQLLGIRSKTELRASDLKSAPDLHAVGCFCIGTDQVDLQAAQQLGIPVFNAPYANTRSVAELVLGQVILLMRRIPEKNAAAHRGDWLKGVDGATEVRGKTLGIVGYGHIGTQLGILAEGLGMRVIFYDIVEKLALGNATKVQTLQDLLTQSDLVSLHVPNTAETEHLITAKEIKVMKAGGFLINASRGKVVDLDALAHALKEKHLHGAAIDVFPVEPVAKGEKFQSPLQGLDTVILTPHIGGSTLEAQENIALDVAEKMARYERFGSTMGAVNFPQIALNEPVGVTRFRHIHKNVPGVLSKINGIFSDTKVNIAAQQLQTYQSVGYAVIDVEGTVDKDRILSALRALPETIRAVA